MYDIKNEDVINYFKNLKSESVDLVVTDPPYKIVSGGCTNKAVTLKGSDNLKSGKVFKNNSIKFKDWLGEVYRVLKNDTHCYIMCNDRNLRELLNCAEEEKFKLLNILTWKKSKHSPNRYYLKNSEFIVMLRKGKAINIKNMGTFTVLEVDNVKEKNHPSEKPVELLNILIENSSKIGDVVLDPFFGSGSAIESCFQTGRNFIGTEIDQEYFEKAKKRMENLISNNL